jgi:hypothetical protein
MGTDVYANGMEIACKAASGKSACQFPDVCFTPPTAPPTPPGVPIPYPNTAMASDCAEGSTTVMICGKEVMLKNKSYIASTHGNEAGNTPKKGIITSKSTGKAYFAAWSMDVKIETLNVPRHFDIMTHNHASMPGNGGPWCYISAMLPPAAGAPQDERCTLKPYKEGCPAGQTPHHCVPDHCFKEAGRGGAYYPGAVKHADGLCVCVSGSTKSSAAAGGTVKQEEFGSATEHLAALAEHGRIHMKFDKLESQLGNAGTPQGTAKLGDLEDAAAASVSEVTGCDKDKLKKQIREHHKSKGLGPDTKLRADPYGQASPPAVEMGVNPTVSAAPAF